MDSIKRFLRWLAGPIPAEEVLWVVNDLGELGVRIGRTSYFLWCGKSFVYKDTHEDGQVMQQRLIRRREFGDACHPLGFDPQMGDDNGVYFEGDGWFPLTTKGSS